MATRTVGFWTAVALVVGNMIGSGVFLLPASLAPFGGVALLGWIVSAGGAILLAMTFAYLARRAPVSGGPYAYTRQAFGDFAGFLIAWGYWVSMWATNAALAVAFVGYLDPFVPSLVRVPASAAALALGAIWLLTAVNLRGIRAAGRVQIVTTALKVLPLLLIGFAGLLLLEPSHFAIADTSARALGGGITATATLTLWAFTGLESATVPAGSIDDPDRTIPRATLVGTTIAAALYIFGTVGVMALVPPATLARTTAPFADAARAFAGDTAAAVVSLGAAISCFGALNGWILMSGQLPFAVASDGLFPRPFRRTSATGAPITSILVGAVLSTALIAMNFARGLVELYTFIILLATLSTLVPYAFSTLAVFLIGREKGAHSGVPRSTGVVAALAFAYALWAIAGAGAEVVYWGFLLLLAGVPFYVWVRNS